jgi:hypothetical protein
VATIMQKLYIVFFGAILSIQTGCTARAYLRSDQAMANPFDKNAAIFIETAKSMTVEEANFMVLLRKEIKESGLQLEDDLSMADYVLNFTLLEPIILEQSVTYEPVFATPYLTQEWPIYYYPVSYMYGLPGLKIHITIFKKENDPTSTRMPLWEAYLVVKKDVYRDRPAAFIKSILDHVGQRFEGRVNVP